MKSLLVAVFGLVLFIVSAPSCKKGSGSNNGSGSAQTKKGFGDSRERPIGTDLQLPPGVSIQGPIKGYSVFTKEFCDNKEEKDARGKGELVRVCVPFFNNTNGPVRITLPHGLIFISKELKTQNGILIETVVVELPPHQVFYLPLFLCCLNDTRLPSAPDDEFEKGPVTNDADMLQLLNVLNTKKLAMPEETALAQSFVWQITHSEQLTSQQQAQLNALPGK